MTKTYDSELRVLQAREKVNAETRQLNGNGNSGNSGNGNSGNSFVFCFSVDAKEVTN